MLYATTVQHEEELKQILQLQQENLKQNVDETEKQSQGFVTMLHDLDILQKMHAVAPSVIIKDDDTVVAYALTMLHACRAFFPPLEPMFENFERISWHGKPLYGYRFYSMGQICVGKPYRAIGLVNMLYQHHKKTYSDQFDFIVTEISTSNQRSLNAHKRVGFEIVNTYVDDVDEWNVVLWDWR